MVKGRIEFVISFLEPGGNSDPKKCWGFFWPHKREKERDTTFFREVRLTYFFHYFILNTEMKKYPFINVALK